MRLVRYTCALLCIFSNRVFKSSNFNLHLAFTFSHSMGIKAYKKKVAINNHGNPLHGTKAYENKVTSNRPRRQKMSFETRRKVQLLLRLIHGGRWMHGKIGASTLASSRVDAFPREAESA